ncbi:hypothetical protein SAMN04487948_1403 [Halogranum amylolyticum]|uniref:Uncharacterized protein n=2 Tax=Halogranum amylolyticum TaxID=660520 RepID=A0A1H8WS65_9EURY|nr:hypothetical protein SAMN04487948_1403 [Halogranum amylolyticum]
MNPSHTVFVLVVVLLLGTVGFEYGLVPTTADSADVSVSTPPDSRSTLPDDESTPTDRLTTSVEDDSTAPDSLEPTTTPSKSVESVALDAPSAESPTARPDAETDPNVRLRVGRIAACGSTCRDVTAHLHNDGSTALTNVDVSTTVYTGDEVVWADTDRVGRIDAGDRYTTTKRMQVGYGEILQIRSNDGAIRVETVVESDEGSTVVSEERRVF